eukprot:gene7344-7556_t
MTWLLPDLLPAAFCSAVSFRDPRRWSSLADPMDLILIPSSVIALVKVMSREGSQSSDVAVGLRWLWLEARALFAAAKSVEDLLLAVILIRHATDMGLPYGNLLAVILICNY